MNYDGMYYTAVLADDEISVLNELKDAVDWAELSIQLAATAQNGIDCLNAILKFHPDLAIIDIKMPDLDGIEVIRKTRELGIETDFILLSGYDSFSYAKEAIYYGVKSYLLKPLNGDELYDALYRACLDCGHQRKGGRGRLDHYKLKINFFNRLLDGKIPEQNIIGQFLRNTEVNIRDSACYVCVLRFDQEAPAFPYGDLVEKLNAGFAQDQHMFWQYGENQIVCIFNASDTLPLQNALKCQTIVQSSQITPPIIGIGDTVSGLAECSYSYNRALTALTYQLYEGNSRIFTWEILSSGQPDLKLEDIDYLPLVQSIVRKDLDAIRAYCDAFIDRLLYVPMPPPNYVFSMCYSLFHMVEEEFSSFSRQEITEDVSAQDLYRLKKLSQIRKWMSDSFCHLSEFIDAVYGYGTNRHPDADNAGATAEDEIIRTAKKYIRDNITCHIKVSDIAMQVHLSPSYFAIYFKNKTNTNLRDFLLTEKMEYARKALMNPDASISEVGYAMGYGDYRSFSRAFKNIHGITPSDFQAKHAHKS